eukprot:7286618-Prymnesium_polylepis.1
MQLLAATVLAAVVHLLAAAQTDVYLVGIPPGQTASYLMGTYSLRVAKVNGRPSYARDANLALWYVDGAWCAGRSDLIGQRHGALVSEKSE